MARDKKTWRDLTPNQQRAIVAAGTVELVITTVALRDLARRPSAQVRGSKLGWVLACVVQPFGPVAYLLKGRTRA
ncbi:hypothetical protein BH11ACT8_BH11ACT8_31100 [soil metagenome]